jgi:hypothetical protein
MREIETDELRPDLRLAQFGITLRPPHGSGILHNHGALYPACIFRQSTVLPDSNGDQCMQFWNDWFIIQVELFPVARGASR